MSHIFHLVIVCNCGLAGILTYRGFSMALIWLQGLKLDISEQTNKNVDFDFLIFDSNLAKLNKNWVNMFQMIIIFTLESKIGFLNLGFGTYYDHCAMHRKLVMVQYIIIFNLTAMMKKCQKLLRKCQQYLRVKYVLNTYLIHLTMIYQIHNKVQYFGMISS